MSNLDGFFEPTTLNDLGKFLTDTDQKPLNKAEVQSKIRQRRSQMLVHSRIYYVLDENIVSDDKWQQWANELRDIQEQYPQWINIDFYDRAFATWNGDSGAFLPLNDPYVVNKTQQVINQWYKENGI